LLNKPRINISITIFCKESTPLKTTSSLYSPYATDFLQPMYDKK